MNPSIVDHETLLRALFVCPECGRPLRVLPVYRSPSGEEVAACRVCQVIVPSSLWLHMVRTAWEEARRG